MGAIIATLEAAGFVAGSPHPTDGRQTILSLTDHFRAWISEGRAARQDWLVNNLRTKLTAAELDQLVAGIEILKRLIDI